MSVPSDTSNTACRKWLNRKVVWKFERLFLYLHLWISKTAFKKHLSHFKQCFSEKKLVRLIQPDEKLVIVLKELAHIYKWSFIITPFCLSSHIVLDTVEFCVASASLTAWLALGCLPHLAACDMVTIMCHKGYLCT